MLNEFMKLPDQALQFAIRQLEVKIESLRFSTTTIGKLLLAQYAERLDQARAEVERRKT